MTSPVDPSNSFRDTSALTPLETTSTGTFPLLALPKELIETILDFLPIPNENSLVSKEFREIILRNIGRNAKEQLVNDFGFNNATLNETLKLWENHPDPLDSRHQVYWTVHDHCVEVLEKLFPPAASFPSPFNTFSNAIDSSLQLPQPENVLIDKIVAFWQKCHDSTKPLSFSDIALIHWIFTDQHELALHIFNSSKNYPLNVRQVTMNGETIENFAYGEVRRQMLHIFAAYLTENGKFGDFLVILGKESKKIIDAGLEWENLMSADLRTQLIENLHIKEDSSLEDILDTFNQLCTQCEKNHLPDLIIGLAFLLESAEDESPPVQALIETIETHLDEDKQQDLLPDVINALHKLTIENRQPLEE